MIILSNFNFYLKSMLIQKIKSLHFLFLFNSWIVSESRLKCIRSFQYNTAVV